MSVEIIRVKAGIKGFYCVEVENSSQTEAIVFDGIASETWSII